MKEEEDKWMEGERKSGIRIYNIEGKIRNGINDDGKRRGRKLW